MTLLMQDGRLYQAPLINLANAPLLIRPLKESEQKLIESAMILCQGNVSEAAVRLGISRTKLYRHLAEYQRSDETVRNLAGEPVLRVQITPEQA